MLHDWLETWGEPIEPDQLSGSFAIQFRDFLVGDAAGLTSVIGARRSNRVELLVFEVETNRPQRPAYPILRREPVGVFLADGRSAPAVMGLRPDFPDTPHQNWMPEGLPASLCIDDRPWPEARPMYTPAELLHRVMKWFDRAGRGQLHDLRQPLDPFFMGQGVDIVFPRDVFELGADDKLELIGSTHDPSNPAVITVRLPRPDEKPGTRQGGFVFVVCRIAPKEMKRIRRAPSTLASLARELGTRGINLIGEVSSRITAWSAQEGDRDNRFRSRLGILLQMPIIGANRTTTGAVDEVAFLTLATVGDIGIALGRLDKSPADLTDGAKFTRLLVPAKIDEAALAKISLLMGRAHIEFDQARARQLAGRGDNLPDRIVLVGAGAIGSLAAEASVREGIGAHWTVIDHDRLLPHNLARHTLGTDDVGLPKAFSLAARIKALRVGVSAEPIVANVFDPDDQEAIIAALRQADLVIDAAASIPVARFLSDHVGTARRASIFYNPAGTSVVLLMEDKDRTTDLRLLEAAYYGEILRVPEFHDHLTRSTGTIPYAGACRAVTNRIPASRAQALSGLVAMGLSDAMVRRGNVLKIWSLSDDGCPAVHTSTIDGVRVVSVLGWTVTLPRRLEGAILRMRAEKLPAETGGVLFGVVDLVKSRIDVVEAWPEPLGSSGNETEFVRGTKGLRHAVESAIGRTLDQVRYIGEWHSHPWRTRTVPSTTDLGQIFWLTSTLASDGCPGLMLIAGDAGVSVNLGDVIKPNAPQHDDRSNLDRIRD